MKRPEAVTEEEKRLRPGSTDRWIVLGLAGFGLLAIADWLLGGVEVSSSTLPLGWLAAGYADDGYALWKPMLAMVLASVGGLLALPAARGLGDLFPDRRTARRHRRGLRLSLAGWVLLHFCVAAVGFVYAWLYAEGETTLAADAAEALRAAMVPALVPWYVLMALPPVLHLADLLRGKGRYGRRLAAAHPVLWACALWLAAALLPNGAVANGLWAFAPDGGLLVLLLTLLVLAEADRSSGTSKI